MNRGTPVVARPLLALALAASPALAQEPRVDSAEPSPPAREARLVAGGEPLTLVVRGEGLDALTGVVLVLEGRPQPGVGAALRPASMLDRPPGATREVVLTATGDAVASADYRLVVTAGQGFQAEVTRVEVVRTDGTLVALEIEGPADVDEGGTARYAAAALHRDGRREPVSAAWSVDDAGAATIRPDGTLRAGMVSWDTPVTLTATHHAATGTVTAAREIWIRDVKGALAAVEVRGPESLADASHADYRAFAIYDDGSQADVTAYAFSWTVTGHASASMEGPGRLAVGPVQIDTAVTVRAVFGEPDGITRTGELRVRVRTWSLSIRGPAEVLEGDPEEVFQNGSAQYDLVVTDADGRQHTVPIAQWTATQPVGVTMSISSGGLLRFPDASRDAMVDIRVGHVHNGQYKEAMRQVQLRHRPVKLRSIEIIAPPEVTSDTGFKPHQSYPFRIRASFRGRSDFIDANPATWTVDAGGGTTISNGGILTTGNPTGDDLMVYATYEYEGISRTASALAFWTPALYLRVREANPSAFASYVNEWETMRLRATLHYADGTFVQVDPSWTVTPAEHATISADGVLTPLELESTQAVTVEVRGEYSLPLLTLGDLYTATILARRATDLRVLPETTQQNRYEMFPGDTVRLAVEATFNDGRTEIVTPTTWRSAQWFIEVDETGLVTAQPTASSLVASVRAEYHFRDQSMLSALFHVGVRPRP